MFTLKTCKYYLFVSIVLSALNLLCDNELQCTFYRCIYYFFQSIQWNKLFYISFFFIFIKNKNNYNISTVTKKGHNIHFSTLYYNIKLVSDDQQTRGIVY